MSRAGRNNMRIQKFGYATTLLEKIYPLIYSSNSRIFGVANKRAKKPFVLDGTYIKLAKIHILIL
jgi:hypothetical protein